MRPFRGASYLTGRFGGMVIEFSLDRRNHSRRIPVERGIHLGSLVKGFRLVLVERSRR